MHAQLFPWYVSNEQLENIDKWRWWAIDSFGWRVIFALSVSIYWPLIFIINNQNRMLRRMAELSAGLRNLYICLHKYTYQFIRLTLKIVCYFVFLFLWWLFLSFNFCFLFFVLYISFLRWMLTLWLLIFAFIRFDRVQFCANHHIDQQQRQWKKPATTAAIACLCVRYGFAN